eukprot:4164213-Prymnesium_polylepis.1
MLPATSLPRSRAGLMECLRMPRPMVVGRCAPQHLGSASATTTQRRSSEFTAPRGWLQWPWPGAHQSTRSQSRCAPADPVL